MTAVAGGGAVGDGAGGLGVLGRGLSFPLQIDDRGRPRLAAGSERVRQALLVVLATAPGERVMRPDFGCAIHDLVFQPNDAALHGVVIERVRDAVVRWEPRVDLLGVSVDVPPDTPDCLLIRVDYRVRADNHTGNLVYPFFLVEGDGIGAGGFGAGGSGGAP